MAGGEESLMGEGGTRRRGGEGRGSGAERRGKEEGGEREEIVEGIVTL